MKTERGYQGNVLLVELIVVVLFFSLAATISLSVFAKARVVTEEAGTLARASETLSDLAETLSLREDAADCLREAGFTAQSGAWVYEADHVTYRAEVRTEETDAGVRTRVTLCAESASGETLTTLSAGGYFEGGTQR